MSARLGVWNAGDAQAFLALRRGMADEALWMARTTTLARAQADEVALLATCERLELYAVGDLDASALGLVPLARGDGALRHLFRVAAGLESRIVGESHILGQVHAAARRAETSGAGGPTLRAAFAGATRCGRRVRSGTALGRLASDYVKEAVARVVTARSARVGVLGSGAVAREAASALRAAGVRDVRLFARHVERAAEAIDDARVALHPLEALGAQLANLDAVIAATSSPRTLVTHPDIAPRREPLLLVDLGVPANVAADVGACAGVRLLGLADIAGPAIAADALREAEAIVETHLASFRAERARRRRNVA